LSIQGRTALVSTLRELEQFYVNKTEELLRTTIETLAHLAISPMTVLAYQSAPKSLESDFLTSKLEHSAALDLYQSSALPKHYGKPH
jgi:hypothetical protein